MAEGMNWGHYAKVAEARKQIRDILGDKYLIDLVDKFAKRFKWLRFKT